MNNFFKSTSKVPSLLLSQSFRGCSLLPGRSGQSRALGAGPTRQPAPPGPLSPALLPSAGQLQVLRPLLHSSCAQASWPCLLHPLRAYLSSKAKPNAVFSPACFPWLPLNYSAPSPVLKLFRITICLALLSLVDICLHHHHPAQAVRFQSVFPFSISPVGPSTVPGSTIMCYKEMKRY